VPGPLRTTVGIPAQATRLLATLLSLATLLLLAGTLLLVALVDLAAARTAPTGAELPARPADPFAQGPVAPAAATSAQDRFLADQLTTLQVLMAIGQAPEPSEGQRPAGTPTRSPPAILSGAQAAGQPGPDDPRSPLPPLNGALLPTGLGIVDRRRPGLPGGGTGGRDATPAAPPTGASLAVGLAQEFPSWLLPGLEKLLNSAGGGQAELYAFLNRAPGAILGLPYPNLPGFLGLSVYDFATQYVIGSQLTSLPETAMGLALVGTLPYLIDDSHRVVNRDLAGRGFLPLLPPINPRALSRSAMALVAAEGLGKDWLQRNGIVLPRPVAYRSGRPVWASAGDYAKNLAYDVGTHFLVTAGAMTHDYWYRIRDFRDLVERLQLEQMQRRVEDMRRHLPSGIRVEPVVISYPSLRTFSAWLQQTWRQDPARMSQMFEELGSRVPAWARWSPLRYALVAALTAAFGKGVSELLWDPPQGWLGDQIRKLSLAADQLLGAPSRDSLAELGASAILNYGRLGWLTFTEYVRNVGPLSPLLAVQRLWLTGRMAVAAAAGDRATLGRLADASALEFASQDARVRWQVAAARGARALRLAGAWFVPPGPAQQPGPGPAPGPAPAGPPGEPLVAQAPAATGPARLAPARTGATSGAAFAAAPPAAPAPGSQATLAASLAMLAVPPVPAPSPPAVPTPAPPARATPNASATPTVRLPGASASVAVEPATAPAPREQQVTADVPPAAEPGTRVPHEPQPPRRHDPPADARSPTRQARIALELGEDLLVDADGATVVRDTVLDGLTIPAGTRLAPEGGQSDQAVVAAPDGTVVGRLADLGAQRTPASVSVPTLEAADADAKPDPALTRSDPARPPPVETTQTPAEATTIAGPPTQLQAEDRLR